MVSRKRNKGKERKAKQAERKAKADERSVIQTCANWEWKGLANRYRIVNNKKITQCDHGFGVVIPNDSKPVSSFMDKFWVNLWGMSIIDNLIDTFNSHKEVWLDENYRQMTINILVCIGSNMMLDERITGEQATLASIEYIPFRIAKVIAILEGYHNGKGDITSNASIFNNYTGTKLRDLDGGGSSKRRDVLKFYRKRLSCSCLKKMHSVARKTMPKIGACNHCGLEKERVLLMVCSRCRVIHCCSEKCQIAGWLEHKGECEMFVQYRTTNM